MNVNSYSEKDTYMFAASIGEKAHRGQIYLLDGELGVGKTVFTKGFAKGMGIKEDVNSPTFTIVQEYEGEKFPLYHFDVYRIGDVEEMEEIGYDHYFFGEGVCLIEWAGRIREILPEECIRIKIEKQLDKGFDYRYIVVEGSDFP